MSTILAIRYIVATRMATIGRIPEFQPENERFSAYLERTGGVVLCCQRCQTGKTIGRVVVSHRRENLFFVTRPSSACVAKHEDFPTAGGGAQETL